MPKPIKRSNPNINIEESPSGQFLSSGTTYSTIIMDHSYMLKERSPKLPKKVEPPKPKTLLRSLHKK